MNEKLEASEQRLAEKEQEIAGLNRHLSKLTRETKGRHEYKDVWEAAAATRRRATVSVAGKAAADESLLNNAEVTKESLKATVGINPDEVALEIGCGVGLVGQFLAPECKRWIGCDVSTNMLEYARQRLVPFDNVELVEVSGYDLSPIEDASVDVVYCTVVFMHLDEWDRYNYILEAHRVLRPGGRVFVDNHNLCSEEGWEVFERGRSYDPDKRPPNISKSSTPQEIEVFLRKGGFREVQTREKGFLVQGYGVK